MIIGIDISRYNMGWNPDNAKKPINFVIQRASWALYKDSGFDALLPHVQKIPIRGAYHYYSSGVSWKAQADLFLSTTANKHFHFYVVDYERAFNSLSRRTIAELYEMVEYIKRQTQKRCMIYFSPDIFKVDIRPYGYEGWANRQDVWIAQYPFAIGQTPVASKPALPAGLNTWKIWQYGGGDVNFTAGRHAGPDYGGGLQGMDLNYFDGTLDDMATWVNADVSVQPPPVTPPANASAFGYLKPRYVPNGPAIIVGNDAPREGRPTHALDTAKQNWIKALNNNDEAVWRLFTAPDVGPTKGINDNGKMIYIQAGWSGNVVKIIGRYGSFVKVDSIRLDQTMPNVAQARRSPWLVHHITTCNSAGGFVEYPGTSPWNRAYSPLLTAAGECWIPVSWVSETATVTIASVNVRSGPATNFEIVGRKVRGDVVQISDVSVDTEGNYWGCIGTSWICLRYGKNSYTSWILH